MKRSSGFSRRRFLSVAAAAAAGPTIIRATALGAEGQPPASERLTMGIIGMGKQATGHLTAIARRSDVQVLAIADCQEERRNAGLELIERVTGLAAKEQPKPTPAPSTDAPPQSTANEPWKSAAPWTAAEGGAGKGKPATSPKDVKLYNDYRDLLARKDIDCVLIATPDHWHAIMGIQACEAGKDIYLEKPLTLTIREGRELVAAVRRYDRVLQTGSQQRSSWEFRFACEMVRNGRIGKLKSISVVTGTPSKECDLPAEPIRKGVDWDMWIGPAPYRPFNKILCPPVTDPSWAMWRLYRDFSGGAMTDFGAHHFDIAQWALDADKSGPVEILPPDGKDVKQLTYRYANGVEVYHVNTGLEFGGKGLWFEGTAGKIEVDRGKLETTPKDLRRTPTRLSEQRLYKSPGHHEDFFRCVRTRQRPICDVEVGFHSVTVCHLGNIAYWLGRPLKWDPAKEEFVGDEEANRWLERPKRAPWIM